MALASRPSRSSGGKAFHDSLSRPLSANARRTMSPSWTSRTPMMIVAGTIELPYSIMHLPLPALTGAHDLQEEVPCAPVPALLGPRNLDAHCYSVLRSLARIRSTLLLAVFHQVDLQPLAVHGRRHVGRPASELLGDGVDRVVEGHLDRVSVDVDELQFLTHGSLLLAPRARVGFERPRLPPGPWRTSARSSPRSPRRTSRARCGSRPRRAGGPRRASCRRRTACRGERRCGPWPRRGPGRVRRAASRRPLARLGGGGGGRGAGLAATANGGPDLLVRERLELAPR